MTWNIQTGKHWKDIAQYIISENVDLIGLQEVDRYVERSGNKDIIQLLAEETGYYSAFAASIVGKVGSRLAGGEFGNAILSRYPIGEARTVVLSSEEVWEGNSETEPRTLLVTNINVGGKRISMCSTHLGYAHKFGKSILRKKQITRLKNALTSLGGTIVLAIDANSLPDSNDIAEIEDVLLLISDPKKCTWPVTAVDYRGWQLDPGPKYTIDYLLGTRDVHVKDVCVGNSVASDHLPIIATIEFE